MEEEEYHFEDDEQEYQKFLAMVQLDPADLIDDNNHAHADKENHVSGDTRLAGILTPCIFYAFVVTSAANDGTGQVRWQWSVVLVVQSSLRDGFSHRADVRKQWLAQWLSPNEEHTASPVAEP